MGMEFKDSADRHGIPRRDTMYVILHPVATEEIAGHPGETTMVYVGHPHAQTDRYVEVIAAIRPPRDLVIFHSMPLTDLYRHLLHERK